MPRVARLVVYDFEDPEALDRQLGRSMSEGVRELGAPSSRKTITIVRIPDELIRLIGRWAAEADRDLQNGSDEERR